MTKSFFLVKLQVVPQIIKKQSKHLTRLLESRNLTSSIHFTTDTIVLKKINVAKRQPEVASNKVVLCFEEALDGVDTSDINLRIKLADCQKETVKFWLRDSEAFKCAYQQDSIIIKHTTFPSVRRLVLNTVSDNVKCKLNRRPA